MRSSRRRRENVNADSGAGSFHCSPSGGTRVADDTVAGQVATLPSCRDADAWKVAERLDTEELDLLRPANGAPAYRDAAP